MSSTPLLGASVILAGLLVLGTKYLSWRRKVLHLPPGPPKLPFIDNLHNMPDVLDWVRLSDMCKEYDTDILHLGALGKSIVVLDTYEAAKELLDKRAKIFSDRPISTMFNLCGLGGIIPFLPYGDRWRRMRRMFTAHLSARTTLIDKPREIYFVRRCLKQLLDEPAQFLDHTKFLVGSIAILSAYGLTPSSTNDRNLQAAERLLDKLSETMEKGFFLVDIFPWLQHVPEWLPGASFQKIARETRDLVNGARNLTFEQAISEMDGQGHQSTSVVSQQLQELGLDCKPSDTEMLKDAALTVYIGAAETVWATLATFILAMVCYPEVQKKAQQELDQVVQGRLPEHDDLKNLPYLMAVYLEVTRWKPVAPLSIAHVPVTESVYEGKRIPKGSLVFANQWSMLQDTKVYPDPSEFIPERFLKDGKIDGSIRSPLDIIFGFGRRSCPGRPVVQSTILMTAASVLSSFDLSIAIDEQGDLIPPTQEYRLSIISYPKPFPCQIVPRSPQARQLIKAWDISESEP